ncbi:MAG: acetyl-CoA acetyltransferase [Aeromicrobium sp.]|uniref:acetyl-CoA acetyltransferase n=1 Tax=Aeromicrobium sp. TaxID=1871063 RepID=UPI00261D121B|nr:acetyl-CoA acetyltransferase [Aeromicrobium sp.]MDF1706048.1 acetyl-CoA acetyltransferase [Aeromicrobium sp.]
MSASNVWILGGHQTDFARNWVREGKDFADLTSEVVDATLTSSGVDPTTIGVVHVGNAFGQLFTGQGHLGTMPATVREELWGLPSSRHEAACASGSIALLSAMSDLQAGHYDAALVVGVELQKSVPGDKAAEYLGAAAWIGHEGQDATFMWPYMFSKIAEEYDRRYGLDLRHLHAISAKNFANAKVNPNAQTRGWDIPDLLAAGGDDTVNPPVEGVLRRFDCSQITDGGAGLVLVTDAYLAAHPHVKPLGRLAGWGHRAVGTGLAQKLERSADDDYVMPHLRQTVLDAFGRAGIDLDSLDGLETHDCFSASEYLAIDHLGLTEPGASWKAIENGETQIGGTLPINPSGGLIGGGHPVGASGVRMLLDATKQVSGTAGAYQVEGAEHFATLNFGGSTATTVSFVVARD